MTYREAHIALKAQFPDGTTYGTLKAACIALAGGYAQGVKLIRGLSQQNLVTFVGYTATITEAR